MRTNTLITRLTRCISSRRFLLPLGPLAFGMVGIAVLATVNPFGTGLLELDGNVVAGNQSPAGDDWNLLNGSGGPNPTGSAGSSVARTFISGPSSPEIFTTGGSKDPADISSWRWKTGSVPAKDLLTNGYAAAYVTGSPAELLLYFGADRFAQNGDANIGVWFFQQQVAPITSGPLAGQFSGVHVNGDIFIVSAFTQGGGVSTITVYAWDSSCTGPTFTSPPVAGLCADNNLRTLSAGSSTEAFAIVNNVLLSGGAAPSWPYTPKSGSAGTFPEGALYEAGINVTELLASVGITSVPCFTSFLEETRSSQSTSAVLKDFIGGSFPLCGLHITKACGTGDQAPKTISNGTQIQYTFTGTVHNTGVGTLSNVSVADTLPDGSSGSPVLSSTTLAPNGTAGDTATWTDTFIATSSNVANPLSVTNSATASSTFGSTTVNSDNTATATCSLSVSATLSVDKHCVAPGPGLSCSSSGCVVQVPFSGHVCNSGSVQLTGITLADDPVALSPGITPNGFTLNPGQCTGDVGAPADPTGTYRPTSATNGSVPGRYFFADTLSITAATAAIGPNPTPVGAPCPAGALACGAQSCPLCPVGTCTTVPLP